MNLLLTKQTWMFRTSQSSQLEVVVGTELLLENPLVSVKPAYSTN